MATRGDAAHALEQLSGPNVRRDVKARAEIDAASELTPIARLAVMVAYASIVIVVAFRHELWRDEVRALTLAIDNGFLEMLGKLRHEGHPALWYLILQIGFGLFHSVRVLPVASALIAASATYLFLSRSPFRWWQKVLFAFGVFPLYEYSVMCRNYGISVLLLFVACCFYKDRLARPLRYGLILALLANTNVHALFVAAGFLASLLLDLALQVKEGRDGSGRLAASCALVAIAILASFALIYPDKTITFTSLRELNISDLPSTALSVLSAPGKALWQPYAKPAYLVVCTIGLLFYRQKQILTMFVVATLGVSALVALAYPSELRHRGVYIMFLIALFWIDQVGTGEAEQGPSWLERWKSPALTLMLVAQVALAARPLRNDYIRQLSSGETFARLVRQDAALKDAIIIGEPDYPMDTLPYYLSNDIYIPREGRYGRRVEFTTASRQSLALHELLETAIQLKRQTGRPVLIALGHKLALQGPFVIDFSYRSVFTYSKDSLEEFLARAAKLAVFDGTAGDENYSVYLVTG
jgi:hypothetical protein